MSHHSPRTYVILNDDITRSLIKNILEAANLAYIFVNTAEEFLHAYDVDKPTCLISEIQLPGMNGLECQYQLCKTGHQPPIIFISKEGDINTAVKAMKRGAVDFYTLPFKPQEILESIYNATQQSMQMYNYLKQLKDIGNRLQELTPREREILDLVVEGLRSKNIARKLGIAFRTVELHRTRIINKMGVKSSVELANCILKYQHYFHHQEYNYFYTPLPVHKPQPAKGLDALEAVI